MGGGLSKQRGNPGSVRCSGDLVLILICARRRHFALKQLLSYGFALKYRLCAACCNSLRC